VRLLPHGNTDVERGFSISNDVLTDYRTEMSAKTLNGLLLTKDALKYCDPVNQRPTSVPLTRSLLTACRSAYAAYEARLEKEKLQIEKEKAKKATSEQAMQEQNSYKKFVKQK